MRQDNRRYRNFDDYQQRVGIGPVRDAGPFMSQPMPAAGGGANTRLAIQAFEAGHDVAAVGLKAALQREEEDRALKATEIVNTWRGGLNEFSAKYQEEKQGELAVNAGREFSAHARQTGGKVLEGIQDEKLRRMVMQSMAGVSMHFAETGMHYGNAQREAWKKSVVDGDWTQLVQDVSQNAYNPDFIKNRVAAHVGLARQYHPGLDMRAYETKVGRESADARLAAMEGRKDYAGMNNVLKSAGDFMHPEQAVRWKHRIEAEQTRQEHEARERTLLVRESLNDELDFAVNKGDFSRMKQNAAEAARLGDQKTADKIFKLAEVYESARPYMDGSSSLPLAEQGQEIAKAFNGRMRPDNAALVGQVRDAALRNHHARVEAFLKDPAGVARQTKMGELGRGGESLPSGDDTPEMYARRNMAVQEYMGAGLPGFTPRVLTAAQAEDAGKILDAPDMPIGEKMQQLSGLHAAYGSLAGAALREIKAPAGVAAAVETRSEKLLESALLPDKDVPKSSLTDGEVKAVVLNSGFMQYAGAYMAARPGNGSLVENTAGTQRALERLVKIHGESALRALSAEYDYVVSSHAVLRLPKGRDIDGLQAGLARIAQNIREFVPDLSARQGESVASKGVWINAGGSATLLVDGQALYSVSEADARKYGAEAVQEIWWQ
jgi:hypothetical protein